MTISDATTSAVTTEVFFYHLERQPLDIVLPTLIERVVERNWRTVVEIGSPERLAALNTLLWTYKPESFLPHGIEADGSPSEQPVYLTTKPDNPNGATVRFLVEGASPSTFSGYNRVVLIFDGRNPDALAAARKHWKAAKALPDGAIKLTYWQQNQDGRWDQKA